MRIISFLLFVTPLLSSAPSRAAASSTASATVPVQGQGQAQVHTTSSSSSSFPVEGVDLPGTQELDGVQLQRNGHGIRHITFLGMNVKVYVAGMYTEIPLTTEDEVKEYLESGSPMQFDFTFLRSVGQGRVTSAWQQQLEHSVSHRYDGYEADRDQFIGMFGPISYHGTETVKMVGDDTFIVDQGKPQGVIRGRDFQQAFLSMWFGEQAVCQNLKQGLLRGFQHDGSLKYASVMA